MQIKDYMAVLLKRWVLIALVGFVAATAAYGFSKLQTPMFRSQTSYTVVPSRTDYGLQLTLPNTMNNWPRLVLAEHVLQSVSDELGIDRPSSKLKEDISIQPRPDELLVLIEADAPDMGESIALSNAIGSRLQQEIANLNLLKEGTDKINITVTERASANNAYLASPKTKVNVLAGAFLGLILGTLLAFVAEYLDDTLKTGDDVERFLGLTTLGLIPTTSSSGSASAERALRGRRLRVGGVK